MSQAYSNPKRASDPHALPMRSFPRLVWHRPSRSKKERLLLESGKTAHVRRQATFGERSRYCVQEFAARTGEIRYLVLDAETVDQVARGVDLPAIIRDEATLVDAVRGLADAQADADDDESE